jgi:hypothetical protein
MCATLAGLVALIGINTTKVLQSMGSSPGLSYKTLRHRLLNTCRSGCGRNALDTYAPRTLYFRRLVGYALVGIFNFLSFETEVAPMIRYGALLVYLCAT